MKKFMALALALVMVLGLSANVFAATSDPNLTNFWTNYTYTVNHGTADTIELMVVPATAYYEPTTFSSVEDAAAVEWRVVPGSTSGVTIDEDYVMGFEYDDDTIVAYAAVNVSATAAVGAASIEAKNPATGATMNFTIVVNGTAASQQNVTYKFYDGVISSAAKLDEKTVTVSSSDYYGNTAYPSALDGVQKVINTSSNITEHSIEVRWGSPALTSLSFVGYTDPFENYTDENTHEDFGWQYRVYRNGNMVELSKLIGADDCQVLAGDTVIWIYGQYGVVQFPGQI